MRTKASISVTTQNNYVIPRIHAYESCMPDELQPLDRDAHTIAGHEKSPARRSEVTTPAEQQARLRGPAIPP